MSHFAQEVAEASIIQQFNVMTCLLEILAKAAGLPVGAIIDAAMKSQNPNPLRS